MARYSIGLQELLRARDSGFQEFLNLAMGRSVVSAADWGPEKVELGLSGDLMLRVFWTPSGLHMNVVSTTNPGEIPPLMLEMPMDARRVPIRLVERRLRALRTVHAAVYLIDIGKGALLEQQLARDEATDIEALLNDEEVIYLEAISPGSWWLTLWAKTRDSYRALITVFAITFPRVRDVIVRKLEAEARIKELEVEEKEFKLASEKLDYALGLVEKLPEGQPSDRLRKRISEALMVLLEGHGEVDERDKVTTRLLGPHREQ